MIDRKNADLNNVNVIVVTIDDLDNLLEQKNSKNLKNLENISYNDIIDISVGEYSLYDLIRLLNTSVDFHTFDLDTHLFIAVDHSKKEIVSQCLDVL